MDPLSYARAQMGLSLAFHMAFAAAGVAMPLFMVIADVLHLRTGDRDYAEFSKRMAKGTSILFAVGAVSGTVLSFELGLLWPKFMGTFGEVIGLPFALEGFAFFTEAIFLGIYLYGRGKISPKLHLAAGVGVALSGMLSAGFVTLVNACMNLPAGFHMEAGKVAGVDPIAAMFSPPWRYEVVHALLACYQATAWALAGIHAAVLLRHRESSLFRKAFAVTFAVAAATALLQPISGDRSAKHDAAMQPAKLAASEGFFRTRDHAPLTVGGIPDVDARETRYGVEVPWALSILAFDDPSGVVTGLDDIPRDEWPPVVATHLAFETMVGTGSLMALVGLIGIALWWKRKRVATDRWFLFAIVGCGPLGLVAMEAGWCVTEMGRQPWIVRGAMRTRDAVTPFHYLEAPFWIFGALYVFLGITVVYLLWRQLRAAPIEAGPPSSVMGRHA